MNTSEARIIGRRLFTDGIERDVFEDAEGRQYVLSHDGEKVWSVDATGGCAGRGPATLRVT
jgi:hypothetical protein